MIKVYVQRMEDGQVGGAKFSGPLWLRGRLGGSVHFRTQFFLTCRLLHELPFGSFDMIYRYATFSNNDFGGILPYWTYSCKQQHMIVLTNVLLKANFFKVIARKFLLFQTLSSATLWTFFFLLTVRILILCHPSVRPFLYKMKHFQHFHIWRESSFLLRDLILFPRRYTQRGMERLEENLINLRSCKIDAGLSWASTFYHSHFEAETLKFFAHCHSSPNFLFVCIYYCNHRNHMWVF